MKQAKKAQYKKPSVKGKQVMRLRATALMTMAAFIIGVVLVFSLVAAAVFFLLVLAAYLLYTLVYVPMYYAAYGYEITQDEIIVKKGVVFGKECRMPKQSIDYVLKRQSFFQKGKGVFTVVIFSSGARVTINHIEDIPLALEERL